jgi:Spy/CpxP family protein refolding chaperone
MASWRGLLITALVALLAGFGGVWLGLRTFGSRDAPGLHEVVHERLALTAEQRRRIETLETAFATRRQALELEMRAANADLADAIRAEHGYGPNVTAAVERFHGAMGRLQSETIRHVFAMREVLNPEQQRTFDDTVISALTEAPS